MQKETHYPLPTPLSVFKTTHIGSSAADEGPSVDMYFLSTPDLTRSGMVNVYGPGQEDFRVLPLSVILSHASQAVADKHDAPEAQRGSVQLILMLASTLVDMRDTPANIVSLVVKKIGVVSEMLNKAGMAQLPIEQADDEPEQGTAPRFSFGA